MLRQVRQRQLYWFCRTCWEEMPLTEVSPAVLTVSSLTSRIKSANRSSVLVCAA